jgi:cytochrome P450
MTTVALDVRPSYGTLAPPGSRALAHIPGDNGWPIVGNTLRALADPRGFFERMAAKHGPVLRTNMFGETGISLLGPDANELMLLDQQRLFSSERGWGKYLGLVFPRGLMLMDFDEHRLHRRALSVGFKAGPMRAYLGQLDAGLSARVAEWRAKPGPMLLYPAMKRLTLDLAAHTFLGGDIGPEMDRVNRAFIDMVAASVSPVRKPLPGTQLRRGIKARAYMIEYFGRQIRTRRERGGDDLFSQLCRATTEDGALLSDRAIVDHMNFFMLAAHDTLTSTLTAFAWKLAANPAWQTKLREEIAGLGLCDGEALAFERLEAMKLTEMAFKETLRQVPPVPAFPRRAVREFEFRGYRIPAGTAVTANPLFTHHMPQVWPEPERFDPERFTDAAQTARHRFAFVPYGGGAHMCLGLNFAYMQAKCFARHLLTNVSVSLPSGDSRPWQMWPIPKPRDGMPVEIAPV